MNPRVSPSKPFPWLPLLLALAVIGAIAAVAWHFYQKRYPSWYEEVRLSDGRIITIHQKRQYFDNYGTNQSWVTLDLPELGGKRVWHSYLMPQRVDVVDGKVYVFGAPRGDRQYSIYRFPKNYLVGFVWAGDEFKRIPFLSLPEHIRRQENVFPCIPQSSIASLKLDLKEQRWCDPFGDRGQFGKDISLVDYQDLAIKYSRRSGGSPITD